MVGHRFGRLTVLVSTIASNGRAEFICKCDCGQERRIKALHVARGASTSCGCARSEAAAAAVRTHGMSSVPEYDIWIQMKQRCLDPNNKRYASYGGRGIMVCDRWLHSFANFIGDMGRRPSSELSIERQDNDKGYSPDNCVWASAIVQANNRRMGDLPKGVDHFRSKLNNAAVVAIRGLHAEGQSCAAIGRQFSVSTQCIDSIIKRKTWKHV